MKTLKFRRIVRSILVLTAVSLAPVYILADEQSDAGKVNKQTQPKGAERARSEPDGTPKAAAPKRHHPTYLGVWVRDIDPALAAHLPGVVPNDEGVLVEAVAEDSPAAKAGIKVHDILLTYDDQKLLASEQFVKLVSNDKSGREVALGLIRAGKSETVKATLAQRPHHDRNAEHRQPPRRLWPMIRQWEQTGRWPAAQRQPEWSNFDSMTLKKLDKNRFHASIRHTDAHGKMRSHEFEGSLAEIQKKIETDDDMTPDERAHLLRSLNLNAEPALPLNAFPDDNSTDF